MNDEGNGKMTPEEHGRQFVYDTRNRLVEVNDADGRPIARYAYPATKGAKSRGKGQQAKSPSGKLESWHTIYR